MKVKTSNLLISLFILMVPFLVHADSSSYPDSLTLRELLVNKQFDELNLEIEKYQKRFEEDITNETAFELAFRALSNPDPAYEELFDQWIKQYSESYIPYLARGYYFTARGWNIRGGSLERSRFPYKKEDMHRFHNLALKDINQALSLNSKITLSYAEKIGLAKSLGDRKLKSETLKAGLSVNPASYEIRKAYLFSIHPHWGGTSEQIAAFLVDTKKYEHSNNNLIPLGGFLDFVNGHLKNDHYKYSDALELMSKALQYGEKPWYHYEMGISHYFLKEYDKSIASHTRALEQYPEYIKSLMWRSWAYRKKKMFAEALGDLDFAAELDPYNFKVIKNRAYVLTRFNQFDEAVEDFKRAVELEDNDAQTWSNLGWYSGYKLNDYQTSVDAYKKATALEPDNPTYMYHYSVALNGMRDCKMSSTLKKYLKLCKDSSSKSCSDTQMKWANEMVNFVKTNPACANIKSVEKTSNDVSALGAGDSVLEEST